MRGAGRVAFAAVMLLIVGTLNIIYGIGALDDANIFVGDTRFVLDNLSTLGWVLIVLGIIQWSGGLSLMAGHFYGRLVGVIAGSLGAIGALLSIGGSYPWWSLGIFALCVYIVHGLIVYGSDDEWERLQGLAGANREPAMRDEEHRHPAAAETPHVTATHRGNPV